MSIFFVFILFYQSNLNTDSVVDETPAEPYSPAVNDSPSVQTIVMKDLIEARQFCKDPEIKDVFCKDPEREDTNTDTTEGETADAEITEVEFSEATRLIPFKPSIDDVLFHQDEGPTKQSTVLPYQGNEPLTYTVFIFDFGDETEASILTIEEDIIKAMTAKDDFNLALIRKNLDDKMVGHLAQELKLKYNKDIGNNGKAFQRLRQECERARKTLSIFAKASMIFEFLTDDGEIDLCPTVTKARIIEPGWSTISSHLREGTPLTSKLEAYVQLCGGTIAYNNVLRQIRQGISKEFHKLPDDQKDIVKNFLAQDARHKALIFIKDHLEKLLRYCDENTEWNRFVTRHNKNHIRELLSAEVTKTLKIIQQLDEIEIFVYQSLKI